MLANECVRMAVCGKYCIEKIPMTLLVRLKNGRKVALEAKYCPNCGNVWFGNRYYCEKCSCNHWLYLTKSFRPEYLCEGEIIDDMELELEFNPSDVFVLRHVRSSKIFKMFVGDSSG